MDETPVTAELLHADGIMRDKREQVHRARRFCSAASRSRHVF